MLRAGPLSEHSALLEERFVNAWILIQDAEAIAANDEAAPEVRRVAAALVGAYTRPISSHLVGPEGDLRSTFRGNSMFEGKSYEAFLRAAIDAER